MKKTLLIFAILFTYQSSQSQGNLQFNKIIYEVYPDTDTTGYYTSGVNYEFPGFTVPSGKVWKVGLIGAHGAVVDGVKDVDYNIVNDSFNFLFRKVGNTYPTLIRKRNSPNDIISEYYFAEGTYNFIVIATGGIKPAHVTVNGIEYNIILE